MWLPNGDTGFPESAKIQMVALTLLAVVSGRHIPRHSGPLDLINQPVTTLPNIDSSLLVLMGIGQGGYLGKKLVASERRCRTVPLQYSVSPCVLARNQETTVALQGGCLGNRASDNQVLLNNSPVATTA
jgi:hypothetical protein